ncbi:translation factor [Coemansia reversa NRRL 1564]|uniref:Threonylcarbamoyl-AMP synthase n=1 Tax=Coemansia reversa (strain ATCC 12441 / NRRL 1564) TaxID=763665 RepID=A0A2G5B385_COERN|nr:translation factor [Coemansia reversa NRRL 1564]|eukprot:PIA13482.1 translation factor [Coemansia reversa NRRL 1564]
MGIATAVRAFHTKVLSAETTQLVFSSALEDGHYTATGSNTQWLEESCKELRANNCVAIPTETVYGLAANALDSQAVRSIFETKGRPSDNPLIVHVSSMRMLRSLYHLPSTIDIVTTEQPQHQQPVAMPFLGTNNVALEGEHLQALLREAEANDRLRGGDGVWPEIPRAYHDVIRRFWPGALTLIMPRPPCIPIEVLGGHGSTVAIRFPSHPVARAVISACGLPLAAPSANASGKPSPTLAMHVKHDLDSRLPLIIDAGACDVGVESTVLDAHSSNAFVNGQLSPCILRPGGVTFEELKATGGAFERLRVYRRDFTNAEIELNPTTPGMKYRHYSPTAPVFLFVPSSIQDDLSTRQTRLKPKMQELLLSEGADLHKVGVVTVGELQLETPHENCELVTWQVMDAKDLAHRIFALLRLLDETEHVDAILVEGVEEANEGLAVMNRLGKAALHHIPW